ncbi:MULTISPECIES: PaaI family thioesterase [Aneurinibacillus]|uniref:Acyl-CoA thioesterase n=1 Tax=Aneurinibacillus thermoaerophilus TaxID=143495 RepID=A0A1G7WVS7_ANETH|nr:MULTISPECIES: hotdog fold thioesterase [Aneurinibacillus]AMA73929.1 phenylacetate degradation protein [Aneurinibacillus sp. XH2]MED0674113.1 hotdog fold thioesterase [Aneurinibacillus thermoaerophilus]MED0678107.1 hotdog fold thioesterase [Aneurinibacillus thermoaerophilus]MED0737706.1 hotdog fold thioesterase [Aneurinibacillus thermoaerophilus]MED0755698.1 hotdog fold thioesterase [Aneurinibacillus thermoaerophilus]
MLSETETHRRYREQITRYVSRDPYARHLGIRLVELGEGTAVAEVDVREEMLNAHGTTHGAVIFALADFAFAAACNSYGRPCVALSMNVQYMAPSGKGARLRAVATEKKKTARAGFYQIEVEHDGESIALLDAVAYRKSGFFLEEIGQNAANEE